MRQQLVSYDTKTNADSNNQEQRSQARNGAALLVTGIQRGGSQLD